MEEPVLPVVDDYGMHNVSWENRDTKANKIIYIATLIFLIFNIICTLCLVLTITVHKKLRGNQNNWPMVYFGLTAFLHQTQVMILEHYNDFQPGRSLSATACVVIQVLGNAVVQAHIFSLLLLLIDRVDWLSDSERHDKRMTPKAYSITIAVLWLTGLVVSVAFFARPVASSDNRLIGCVSIMFREFFVYMGVLILVEILLLVAIFIAALIVYRKRPVTEDKRGDPAEAKQTVIITCVLSALMLAVIICEIVYTEIQGLMNILNYFSAAYDGIASLLMLFVLDKIRRGFFCQNSDKAEENVPLL